MTDFIKNLYHFYKKYPKISGVLSLTGLILLIMIYMFIVKSIFILSSMIIIAFMIGVGIMIKKCLQKEGSWIICKY